MKIGVFGDLHEGKYLDQIIEEFNDRGVDIILANGDFVDDNSKLYQILKHIISKSKYTISIIPGNHEKREDWYKAINRLQKEHITAIYLKRFYFKDYQFITLPYGETIKSNVFKYVDEKTIIQMHKPPKYYGDLVCYNISKMGRKVIVPCQKAHHKKNEGDIELTNLIESKLPKLVVAGHIHKQKAQSIPERVETMVSNHLFVNPGPAKYGYYAIIEVEEEVTAYLKRVGDNADDNFHKNYYKLFSNL